MAINSDLKTEETGTQISDYLLEKYSAKPSSKRKGKQKSLPNAGKYRDFLKLPLQQGTDISTSYFLLYKS